MLGCSDHGTVAPAPTPASTEELIVADCYTLRDAMEAFAAENGGYYPGGLNAQSAAGHRFDSFLPAGGLTNRYTGFHNQPLFYDSPWPGEIGVLLFPDGYQINGYRITGGTVSWSRSRT